MRIKSTVIQPFYINELFIGLNLYLFIVCCFGTELLLLDVLYLQKV